MELLHSIANYDIFLYSQANNSGINSNITITVSSNSSDATSRATLTSAPKNWNITDLGNEASVAPTVSGTTIASNNTTIAVVIAITITFSEAVNVTGTPQITLETGGTDAVVNYSSGSGTNTLTFNYTVAAGHTSADLDYVATTSLALNSGTIKDAALNAATLTLPAIGAAGSLADNTISLNDQAAPTVTGTTVASNNSTIAVTFNQAVFNTNGGSGALQASDFALSISGGVATVNATPSSISISGNVYTLGLTLTGTPSGAETLTVVPSSSTAIYDASGNAASTTQSNNTVSLNDQAVPIVSGTTIASNNSTIAVTFNEAIYNTSGGSGALEASDFALSISGGVATVNATPSSISISGNVYTLGLNLSGTPDGAETLTVVPSGSTAIYDTTGNAASTTQSNNTISLNDQAAPIITNVTSTEVNGSYSTGEVIPITVTFNKVVNVTGIPQITLETGSSDAVVNYSSGTGSNTLTFNYTVAAGHTSSDLDYVATSSLALNSGTIKDAAVNVATLTLASPAASGSLGANKAIVIRNDPVASNISASTIQNTNASINLVASDADFNSLTFSIVSNPSYGSVSLSGSTATYTPTANFQGTDTFTFKANDDSADSSVKTVTIKVFGNYRTTQTRIGSDIDGSGGGLLGYSLDFNEDHTIMAVGAPYSSSKAGAVKVYNWNGSAWAQLGSDISGSTGDHQGWNVSLSSDGTTLAVGAPFHETNKGTVRVYNWNGSTWSQLGIDLDGAGSGDMQGLSVSLSSNGTTLATGAPYHDFGKGTVRVYKWAGGTWSQLGTDSDGVATGDLQGQTVSLSSNGTTLATGAAGHDSGKGTVRVYNWNGSAWSLLGNEGDLDGLTGDKQGHSISLSSNGTILATGALEHDNDSKGTVRVL